MQVPSFIRKEIKMSDQNIKRVYDVSDIQKILGLGRSKTYEFLDDVYKKKQPFNVIKIGKLYKVPKDRFDKWINGEISIVESEIRY